VLRFVAGALCSLLLVTGAFLIWQSHAARGGSQSSPAQASTGSSWFGSGAGQPLRAPEASEKSREEKRFSRYDKNKDGKIQTDEYLAARRKNFDKLDLNHDGKLSFEEYASKAIEKFNGAGGRKGWLNEAEFATTAPVRKPHKTCACRAPVPELAPAPADEGNSDDGQ
jgi:hypothetical protein